jgi:hypothetical protein
LDSGWRWRQQDCDGARNSAAAEQPSDNKQPRTSIGLPLGQLSVSMSYVTYIGCRCARPLGGSLHSLRKKLTAVVADLPGYLFYRRWEDRLDLVVLTKFRPG